MIGFLTFALFALIGLWGFLMSEFHKPLTEGPWDDCDLCGDSSGRLFCDLWSGLWVCDSCSRKGAKV